MVTICNSLCYTNFKHLGFFCLQNCILISEFAFYCIINENNDVRYFFVELKRGPAVFRLGWNIVAGVRFKGVAIGMHFLSIYCMVSLCYIWINSSQSARFLSPILLQIIYVCRAAVGRKMFSFAKSFVTRLFIILIGSIRINWSAGPAIQRCLVRISRIYSTTGCTRVALEAYPLLWYRHVWKLYPVFYVVVVGRLYLLDSNLLLFWPIIMF